MKFGSLFSGIGGIDLGLERAGMTCIWQSEIEPYACQVLAKHWPNIPNLGDIRDIDWTTVERADVVAGGYPCQPFSVAGRREGEDDPRHLWPLFAECLRVLRPRYALLENVAGHLSLGFGQVLADLAALGYDTRWDCIPAAAVGAPHFRDRVFVVAHSGRKRLEKLWISPSGGKLGQPPRKTDETRFSQIGRWTPEPNVGRVAHGIPRRMDRLRALGNAVVPQVAEHIGNIIMEADNDCQIEAP
jgi:DNA (cytosine-5)-methyltransferase 1